MFKRGRVLHVADVLPDPLPWHFRLISAWAPPEHAPLTILPCRSGFFERRWLLVCPKCRRKTETLFVAPGGRDDDWRCSKCWGLIYAIQRWKSLRHPLRRVLTHRKREALRREVLRQ